ncbi:hypothetical protein [uncultured Novosphingobium sp.]|uniref:hypothetical protein n=1 Tax=uncultured Novosphingobium sp. TaxID=292277 RepID=UPI0037480045
MTAAVFTRQDVQHVSDVRLIALAKLHAWRGDSRYEYGVARMKDIVAACEEIIARGPEDLRHIIEHVPTAEAAKQELRLSVFGK